MYTRSTEIRRSWFICLILMILLLSGCQKSSTEPETPENPTGDIDGIWNGAFLFEPVRSMLNTFVYIDPGGQTYICSYDTSETDFVLSAYGKLEHQNTRLGGSFGVFHSDTSVAAGLTISEGQIQWVDFQGQQVRGMNANFSGTAYPFTGNGTLALNALDTLYQTPSQLSLLSGNWVLVEGNSITTLQIATTGQVSGGTNWGAIFSGRVEINNPERNLYRFSTFTISNAGPLYDGNYQGVTAIIGNTLPVVMVKTDESGGFYASFVKQ